MIVGSLAVLLSGCAEGVPADPPLPAAVAGGWTAEIRVYFSGCTSCAECRSAIRQISQVKSGSDRVEFKAGRSRIVYPAPAQVRAIEVANALDESLLIKGDVDRVELTLEGEADGRKSFRIPATGQTWPLAEGSAPIPAGRSVVILASLEGWKGKDAVPALKVREILQTH